MGIFKKREKKEESSKLPSLPKLEFPSYEPQIQKREGLRNKDLEETMPRVQSKPIESKYTPSIPTRKIDIVGGKPLFIKIEKYKDAINDLENVKKRVREAESILKELERLKAEEEQEIENWKIEMEKIKIKLLDVDKKLFEESQNE